MDGSLLGRRPPGSGQIVLKLASVVMRKPELRPFADTLSPQHSAGALKFAAVYSCMVAGGHG